ncbi:MAG: Mur ligase family protein [Nocardioidaceae bacterium]
MHGSLIQLRVLEGANLYFRRPAVRLILDLTSLVQVTEREAARFGQQMGLRGARPGAADSGFRQRFAARAVARLVRRIAAEAGTDRLEVRVRPTSDVHRLVVAYPWRHRLRAEALAGAVAEVLDSVPVADLDTLVERVARSVREADLGPAPRLMRPRIPVVAITGTNGKTTTARMVAQMGRCAGKRVGWSSSDGIYVDDELVEPGDHSGPGGAHRVLARPEVELAVTETAGGGILLLGIGVTHNDVSVVLNVHPDDLGLHGIDTIDQLAELKGVVTQITRSDGWCVLNGDDPRVWSMRALSPARPWAFSRHPGSPALREALREGGRAITVLDGWISLLHSEHEPEALVEIAAVPIALAGRSRANVENCLAAASAGLAAGMPHSAVVTGLESFTPTPKHNPGRTNLYSLGDITVVLDLAHNEAGLQALLEVMRAVRPAGARLLLPENLTRLLPPGVERREVTELPAYASEQAALRALVSRARPGDVLAVTCHQDRGELDSWLRAHGAEVLDAAALRRKLHDAGRSDPSGTEVSGADHG